MPLKIADDFGLSPGVNKAIVDLAERGIINAVSCILVYNDKDLRKDSWLLKNTGVKLGIHFTLTSKMGWPLSKIAQESKLIGGGGQFHSSTLLALLSYCGQLDPNIILSEFKAQLAVFREIFHQNPYFLDSHEHVHQLPRIREAFFQLIEREHLQSSLIRTTAQLMSPGHSPLDLAKRFFLRHQGRNFLKRVHLKLYRDIGPLVCNLDYGSTSTKAFSRCQEIATRRSATWLTHPGEVDDLLQSRDSLTEGRLREYTYLLSSN